MLTSSVALSTHPLCTPFYQRPYDRPLLPSRVQSCDVKHAPHSYSICASHLRPYDCTIPYGIPQLTSQHRPAAARHLHGHTSQCGIRPPHSTQPSVMAAAGTRALQTVARTLSNDPVLHTHTHTRTLMHTQLSLFKGSCFTTVVRSQKVAVDSTQQPF